MKQSKLMRALVIRHKIQVLRANAHRKSRFQQWEDEVDYKLKMAEFHKPRSRAILPLVLAAALTPGPAQYQSEAASPLPELPVRVHPPNP